MTQEENLTIMENYEEKYKEALEWMRSIYPTMQGAEKEDAEHYFPELCESEDERIRKEILEYFQQFENEGLHGVNISDWIAWLEKQQDNNEDSNILQRFSFYSYKDEPNILYLSGLYVNEECRNKGIGTKILEVADEVAKSMNCHAIRLKTKKDSNAERLYRTHGYNSLSIKERDEIWLEKQREKTNPYSGISFEYNGHIWGMCARDNGVDILCDSQLIKHIEKQGEKKSATEHSHITPNSEFFQWIYDRLKYVYHENPNVDYMLSLKERIEDMQKPTWSEEDSKNLNSVKWIIENSENLNRIFETIDSPEYIKKYFIDWLKSLKDRVQPQPKQEWSEEDENLYNLCIAGINTRYNAGYFTKSEYKKAKLWLKSLKDSVQPNQKWSKEDEKNTMWLVRLISTGGFRELDSDKMPCSRIELLEWLKSLKSQKHWKPSEEQMEELEYVTRGNSYPHLTSLYQDLKNI